MPIYAYHCDACGRDADQFNRIADRQHGPDCCGAPMAQMLTACMVSIPGGTDIDYRCTITGENVQSMRKRQYIMEKHDLVDARDLKPQWERTLAAQKAERDAAAKEYNSLPDAVKKAVQQAAPNPPAGA